MKSLRAWLAMPFGWFTFVLAEYVVVIAVIRALFPHGFPAAAGWAILAGSVVGLFVLNLWIRRRLFPADGGESR